MLWRPNDRKHVGEPQVEFCALCGAKVHVSQRIQSQVQGLDGQFVCDIHPNERKIRTNPSWLDRGGPNQVGMPSDYIEPHSGVDWIDRDESELEGNVRIEAALKLADEARTSTIITADSSLQVGLTPGRWIVEGCLLMEFGTALKLNLGGGTVVPATFRGSYSFVAGGGIATFPATTLGATVTNTGERVCFYGVIDVSISGALAVAWAPNVGVSLTVYKESWLRATKIVT